MIFIGSLRDSMARKVVCLLINALFDEKICKKMKFDLKNYANLPLVVGESSLTTDQILFYSGFILFYSGLKILFWAQAT